jgi:signal transduction histidine kinase
MQTRSTTDAKRRLTQLHRAATELQSATTRDEVYDLVIDAAVEILGFDWCAVVTPGEKQFVVERLSAGAPLEPGTPTLRLDEGLTARTFREQTTVVFGDLGEYEEAKPVDDSFTSCLSAPLGKWGVFQCLSAETDAFDDQDREAAELLASHATAALGRIEHEQTLREQNERLEKFASVVSHDLRNPLNVATLRLGLLEEESESEHISAIEESLDRMEELISDLLHLSRVGDDISDRTPVSLPAAVEECWEMHDTADATLVVEDDLTVMADRSRLKQVLENLIGNAIEHGGSDVTVRVGDTDDGFYLEDTGTGIPEGERDRIFQSGYSGSADGTGFGLAIVADIVDAHGWSLRVTESPEGGARFEVADVDI